MGSANQPYIKMSQTDSKPSIHGFTARSDVFWNKTSRSGICAAEKRPVRNICTSRDKKSAVHTAYHKKRIAGTGAWAPVLFLLPFLKKEGQESQRLSFLYSESSPLKEGSLTHGTERHPEPHPRRKCSGLRCRYLSDDNGHFPYEALSYR